MTYLLRNICMLLHVEWWDIFHLKNFVSQYHLYVIENELLPVQLVFQMLTEVQISETDQLIVA